MSKSRAIAPQRPKCAHLAHRESLSFISQIYFKIAVAKVTRTFEYFTESRLFVIEEPFFAELRETKFSQEKWGYVKGLVNTGASLGLEKSFQYLYV